MNRTPLASFMRASRLRPLAWLVAVLALCFAQSASAQSAPSTVTVLSFIADGEFDDLPSQYFNVLRAQIEFHPDYQLNDVPAQSLEEMLMFMGCPTLTVDCARDLRDAVGSDFLAWGEFHEDNGVTALRLVMWDLVAGQELRARTHALRNGRTLLRENAPLLARSLLYESGGALTVTSSPAAAQVFINEELRGVTPLTIENLPIGVYTVRLETTGYSPRSEVALVDLSPTAVDAVLSAAVARRTEAADASNAQVGRIASYVILGAGVGLLGGGIAVGIAKNNTQDEFDALLAQPVFNRSEAEQLQDDGEGQALLSNLLIGAGAAAIVTGAVLAIVYRGSNETAPAAAPAATSARPRVTPYVGVGGTGLQLDWTF